MLAFLAASSQTLPACNTHVFTRHGDRLEMTTGALGRLLNQRLAAVHSHFSDLQLTTVDGNHLKIAGKKDGTPMAISGPVDAQNGQLVLHTDHITKNGSGEMMLMSLFGKTLSDYLNLKKTKSLRVDGNDLHANPDRLLQVRGDLKSARVVGDKLILQFANRPCR